MRDGVKLRILILIFIVILPAPSSAMAAAGTAGGYDFAVRGLDAVPELRARLVEDSLLTRLADSDAHPALLRRRAENDRDGFIVGLRAAGYFGAVVALGLDETHDPVQITFTIDEGPLYTLGPAEIAGMPDPALLNDLPVPVGDVALPEAVQAAERAIITRLMENGYAAPRITARVLRIDHEAHRVSVALTVDAGMHALFGPARLDGLDRLDPAFVARRVAWAEGEPFDIRKIVRTRQALMNSGVIGHVDMAFDHHDTDTPQTLPVDITVRESKPRTIGAGVAYGTMTGLAGNASWEHRNLRGGAERLRLQAQAGMNASALDARFTKPDLLGRRALSLSASARTAIEDFEAYDSRTLRLGAAVNWAATSRLTLSGGVGMDFTRIEENGTATTDNFTLLSLPLSARYDGSDNALDPTRGVRAAIALTPYQSVQDDLIFAVIDAQASHYMRLNDRTVWANRVRMATVQGQNADDIPADKRLYAGGGGSARGYGYQMAGPLDANGKPTGGRTALEAGTELRLKLTDTIGMTAFIDAAHIGDGPTNRDEGMLWSAGLGGRYHTIAGPVRVDIAVPMKKRRADDGFQFYISLGQAF